MTVNSASFAHDGAVRAAGAEALSRERPGPPHASDRTPPPQPLNLLCRESSVAVSVFMVGANPSAPAPCGSASRPGPPVCQRPSPGHVPATCSASVSALAPSLGGQHLPCRRPFCTVLGHHF